MDDSKKDKKKKDKKKDKKDKKDKKRQRDGGDAQTLMDPEGKKWALEDEKQGEKEQQFVWAAKKEKLIQQGIDPSVMEKEQEARRLERLAELERLKEKRIQRDKEAEEWERQKRQMDLQNENWSHREWLMSEKKFHLKQAQERAEIRLREGRPKPIDILHKNMEVDTRYDFEMKQPYEMLIGLNVDQLKDLENDVDMYLELSPDDADFWKALKLLCAEQIAVATGKRSVVPMDVQEVFENQTLEQLKELKQNITEQLEEGEDPEYWELMDRRCEVEIARVTLSKIHAEKLQARLARVEEERRADERVRLEEKLKGRMAESQQQQQQQQQQQPQQSQLQQQQKHQQVSNVNYPASAPSAAPSSSSSSLVAVKKEDGTAAPAPGQAKGPRQRMKLVVEEVVEVADEEAQEEAENDARIQQLLLEAEELAAVIPEEPTATGRKLTEQELFAAEAQKGTDENEERFVDEVESELQKRPHWSDKYAPRKPLYFNRVRTGYEWNKYNSTHYDKDNPPPKVVHGYRFNIFYCDLLDPSKAPTFKVEPIPGNSDWVILRFRAGPPYLDVAFKIVNRVWEHDSKFGYKAVFERGVLRLWFNFKRNRYRR